MAEPFLKWAGGKRQLAPAVVERAPGGFKRYIEPFLGGGAVFFALREAGFAGPALLADANAELLECYVAVRDEVEAVIEALAPIAQRYLCAGPEERARLYYEERANEPSSAAGRATRLLFLNRTCYNGLYRVNRAGKFNVPHGRYRNPGILDEGRLRAASRALQGAEICAGDFAGACREAGPGDFVYLDPPYHPLSQTASFTAYTADSFGAAEQARLRDEFEALTQRGAGAILSNSDHPAICGLYEGCGFTIERVAMSRAINSVGTKRSAIPELLISNFGRPEVRRAFGA